MAPWQSGNIASGLSEVRVASSAATTAMNSMTKADSASMDAPFSIRMAMTFSFHAGSECLRMMAAVARNVSGDVVRKIVSSRERQSFQEPTTQDHPSHSPASQALGRPHSPAATKFP